MRLRQQVLRYFNSQPHEEADHLPVYPPGFRFHFNSQPHEEADDISVAENVVEI